MKNEQMKSNSKDEASLKTYIEIFPSLQCNLNCAYCDRGDEKSILEDFNDIKVLYSNLQSDPGFNLLEFRISGREPTLYPRVNELISFLSNLSPSTEICFFTNGIKLTSLKEESLKKIKIYLSVYPYTRNILEKNIDFISTLKSRYKVVIINISAHEVLDSPGKIRNDFEPLSVCLSATLLTNTKRVYPCCRAHKWEQMYKKNYHFYIDTHNLYKKLKDMIKNTDLCARCPRMYKDSASMSLKLK